MKTLQSMARCRLMKAKVDLRVKRASVHSVIYGILVRRRLDAPRARCNGLLLGNRGSSRLGSGSRFDTFASSNRRRGLITKFLAGSSFIGGTTSGGLTCGVGTHISLLVFRRSVTFRTSRGSRGIDNRRERCDNRWFALGW